ncbi:hypothetical protein JHK82_043098 [Glycine max]|uniref:Protein kinase domain-containing protein n=1 Tax=Glycine max TaxID=3847 RepID=K7MCQ7_SOYBN|nr:hypothetical protein JHK87_043043 [Glycine soja]KAG5106128.1 hypothetical protein JHK82_043098 [Glycine max]
MTVTGATGGRGGLEAAMGLRFQTKNMRRETNNSKLKVVCVIFKFPMYHRVLVYEYLPTGSLENQLFRRFSASLSWSMRMKIVVGAVKGLAFLHEAEKPVIYRDFKASKILLGSKFITPIYMCLFDLIFYKGFMGTHGYAALEYIITGNLTTLYFPSIQFHLIIIIAKDLKVIFYYKKV